MDLVSNLMASLKGCTTPPINVLLGPKRIWLKANTFRSTKVKKATLSKRGINVSITFKPFLNK